MNEDSGFVPGLIIGILLNSVAAWLMWSSDIQSLKDAAVKNGKAEYFFDSTYTKQWRWK